MKLIAILLLTVSAVAAESETKIEAVKPNPNITALGPTTAVPKGASLEKPNSQIKRMFPGFSLYKVRDLIPKRLLVGDLFEKVQKDLRGLLDAPYEKLETPHTFYIVFKNDRFAGVIHGVNALVEKGRVELFLAYDADGKIKEVYVQKMDSTDASAFRSRFYRRQFHRFGTAEIPDPGYIHPPMRMPSPTVVKDHHHFIRAAQINALFTRHLWHHIKE